MTSPPIQPKASPLRTKKEEPDYQKNPGRKPESNSMRDGELTGTPSEPSHWIGMPSEVFPNTFYL
jgi:hypothetical protein